MNNSFTFVLLIVTIVLIFRLAHTWLQTRKAGPDADEEMLETLKKIDALEERIQVLERIVTENRYDLKRDIDSL